MKACRVMWLMSNRWLKSIRTIWPLKWMLLFGVITKIVLIYLMILSCSYFHFLPISCYNVQCSKWKCKIEYVCFLLSTKKEGMVIVSAVICCLCLKRNKELVTISYISSFFLLFTVETYDNVSSIFDNVTEIPVKVSIYVQLHKHQVFLWREFML